MDSIRQWLDSAGRYPLLRPAEVIELSRSVRAWQDHPGGKDAAPAMIRRRGLRARNKLVNCNLRLVVAIVKRRARLTEAEMLDLLQEGAIGLVRAAEKFDGTRGYRFSTYAFNWVRQSIGRAIERQNIVHVPSHVQQTIRAGRDKSPELQQAAALAWKPRSIDAPPRDGDPGESMADSIGGPCLSVEPLAWAEALAAARQVDAEAVELLARRGEGGESTAALALEVGLQSSALSARLLKARRRLRGLAEVQSVMAT